MSDPALIAVFENGLHPQAKYLYSILYAYANAGGVAVVAESLVASAMGISPARLRGYRSELNRSGYCSVALRGENIIFQMTANHPARENSDVARDSDHPVSDPDPLDNQSTRGNSDVARGNSVVARENSDVARAWGGIKGGGESERDLTPLPEKNSLTHSFSDAERKMSVAILTDPAILMRNPVVVHRLAAAYPFEEIRCHCCDLFAEQRDPGSYAGLIEHRLRTGATVPPLRHNELWQRHRTAEEIAAEEKERAESAALLARWKEEDAERLAAHQLTQPPAHPLTRSPVPADAARIWQMALNDLALSMPAPTFETWLRDTDVLSHADGEFVIGVPHAFARDWLQARLHAQVKRILSRLTQRSTEVKFAVREREDTRP